jgi:tetrapyrrole methylase family protein/MazG family protein
MKEFDKLVAITDHLLGPQGCPWDREQTLKSVRSSLLEEACEVIDAINQEEDEHLVEELGDLFFNAVFLSRLAQIEGRGTLQNILQAIENKLIRRHPHVFGDVEIKDSQSAKIQWEELKKKERGKELRKSALDGIPRELPALAKAQKMIKKIKRSKIKFSFEAKSPLSDQLLKAVIEADEMGLDAEQELRDALIKLDESFRKIEACSQ